MNDLTLNWKRISKGLPRAKNSSRTNNKRLTVTSAVSPDITGSFDLEETSNSVSHIIFSLRYLTVEVLVILVVLVVLLFKLHISCT